MIKNTEIPSISTISNIEWDHIHSLVEDILYTPTLTTRLLILQKLAQLSEGRVSGAHV